MSQSNSSKCHQWTGHDADGRPLILSCYGPDIIRVQVGAPEQPRPSLIVQALPTADAEVTHADGVTAFTTGHLTAQVDVSGNISFHRSGKMLFKERGRNFPPNTLPRTEDRLGAEQTWSLRKEEALYGLGQFQDGVMNRRGTKCTLIHGNVTVVVPFVVSTGGWGILWDNASHTEFEDNAAGMRLWSEVADGVDYYVCVGANPEGVIAGYRRLTGAAPLFPRGFYAFIQCKERYASAEELVDVTQEHRDRNLPLDVIVQDWRYWGETEHWSSMVHDPESYGDLPGAIQRIHDLHVSVMISIWPVIGPAAALHKELDEAGHLFPTIHWSSGKIYDAFSPEARAIYWRHAQEGLFAHDVDAWWMDGTEPEFVDCHDQQLHKASLLAERDTAAGSWARVLNAFSLVTTRGVYEGQRATTDDKRVFILTRSAFAGQQAYAAATWSGDISANWDTFAKQVPAGLNFCASGIPYWTTDNGAFFVRGRGGTFPQGVQDPAFREFFLRWTQYSVFCPLMRSHGTQTPREMWQFGQPGERIYDSLVACAQLRMRLLPYTYSLAYEAWLGGGTPMQPIGFRFPSDQASLDITDQFFYGSALMVSPVLQPMEHFPTERCDVLTAWGQCKVGEDDGIRISVFTDIDAELPAVVRQSFDDFDHSWSGNAPAGTTSERYRVEFLCDLVTDVPAKRREDRTLLIQVAGRIRVTLDGVSVVDDWQEDAPLREYRLPVPGRDADRIPLHISYGHTSGEAIIRVGWDISDQLPKMSTGPQERAVYLPPGGWYDFWRVGGSPALTGSRHIQSAAPLDHIPVYVPAGSILPLGQEKQWHNEYADEELELRVYPGENVRYVLYEDAGNTYAYERGESTRIEFTWDENQSTLRIGDRVGAFPGMLSQRRFLLRNMQTGLATTVIYEGTARNISLTS
jgi:alpha-D-xyloside xylohydrolase